MPLEPFQGGEILLILAIALLLFGPRKLPELARGLGQAIREFKQAMQEASGPAKKNADTQTR